MFQFQLQWLLSRNADPDLRDGLGQLPIDVTRSPSVRKLLGARRNAIQLAEKIGQVDRETRNRSDKLQQRYKLQIHKLTAEIEDVRLEIRQEARASGNTLLQWFFGILYFILNHF